MQISKISSFYNHTTFGKKPPTNDDKNKPNSLNSSNNDFYLSKISLDALRSTALATTHKYKEKTLDPGNSPFTANLNSKIEDFYAESVADGGMAMYSLSELSNIANDLEICSKTVIESIQENKVNRSNLKYSVDENNNGELNGQLSTLDLGRVKVKVKFKNTPDGIELKSIKYKNQEGITTVFKYSNGILKSINVDEKVEKGKKKYKETYVLGKNALLESYSQDVVHSKDKTKMKKFIGFKYGDRVNRYMTNVEIDNLTSNLKCKKILITEMDATSQVYAENATIINGRLAADKFYILDERNLKKAIKRIKE